MVELEFELNLSASRLHAVESNNKVSTEYIDAKEQLYLGSDACLIRKSDAD